MSHINARLTVRGRLLLIDRVIGDRLQREDHWVAEQLRVRLPFRAELSFASARPRLLQLSAQHCELLLECTPDVSDALLRVSTLPRGLGRGTVTFATDGLFSRFDATGGNAADWKPSFSVAPTDPVPIVREWIHDETVPRDLDLASWGLKPGWAKPGGSEASDTNGKRSN